MRFDLEGGKQHFHHFPASYRHIHMKQSFPTLSSLCIAPAAVLLLSLVVGGMGLCTKYHARSWISVLGISSACYVYTEHKNLWKRWQHHPIFCVYGTFLPPQIPHSLHTHIFLQPLVYLSQPDFSEALKNTLSIFLLYC